MAALFDVAFTTSSARSTQLFVWSLNDLFTVLFDLLSKWLLLLRPPTISCINANTDERNDFDAVVCTEDCAAWDSCHWLGACQGFSRQCATLRFAAKEEEAFRRLHIFEPECLAFLAWGFAWPSLVEHELFRAIANRADSILQVFRPLVLSNLA